MIDEPPAGRDHGGDPGAGRTRAAVLLNRIALGFCAVAVAAALAAWLYTGVWRHLLSAAGFACVAWVLSRIPFSVAALAWPPPDDSPAASRAETVVQWLGWGLIVAALATHWFG